MKVVYIDKGQLVKLKKELKAKEFWNEVLKYKCEEQAKKRGRKLAETLHQLGYPG